MRHYLIREHTEVGTFTTRCNDWQQAKRLFAKLQAAGANCILYFYGDDGKRHLEDANFPKVTTPGMTHNDTGDFNDHSGLVEHSTLERRYSRTGRL